MGALKGRSLGSRIGKPASRLRTKVDTQGQSIRRPERSWYNSPRWKRLRREVLIRDQFTCQVTGVLLAGKYPADDSPTVDHKRPHRWDPDLFWDINNLHAVSKGWHDSVKQSLERRGLA